MKPYKIDLHIHSPASFDYKGDRDIEKWIETLKQKLKENNIEIIAITDHEYFNKEYFNFIKNLLGDEILVLPGMEIRSKYRSEGEPFDIIVVGDNGEKGIEFIENVFNLHEELEDPDMPEESRWTFSNETNTLINKKYKRNILNFEKVNNLASSLDFRNKGIIIPHYGKGSNNLKKSLEKEFESDGSQIRSFVNKNLILIEEAPNKSSNKFFIDSGISISSVHFSDNHDAKKYPNTGHDDTVEREHGLPTIISNKNFQSIYYAITSPETRVFTDEKDIKISNENKNSIQSVKFTNSLNEEQEIFFSPNSNAIVGERGSGKTFLLLSMINNILGDSTENESFKKELNNYKKIKNKKLNIYTKTGEPITQNEIIFWTQDSFSKKEMKFIYSDEKNNQQKLLEFLEKHKVERKKISLPKEWDEKISDFDLISTELENINISYFNTSKLQPHLFKGNPSKSWLFANNLFNNFTDQLKISIAHLTKTLKNLGRFKEFILDLKSNFTELKKLIVNDTNISKSFKSFLNKQGVLKITSDIFIEKLKKETITINEKIDIFNNILIQKNLFPVNSQLENQGIDKQVVLVNKIINTNKLLKKYLQNYNKLLNIISFFEENVHSINLYDTEEETSQIILYDYSFIKNIDKLTNWAKKIGNNIKSLTRSTPGNQILKLIVEDLIDENKSGNQILFSKPKEKIFEEITDILLKRKEDNGDISYTDFFNSSPGERSSAVISLILESFNRKAVIFLDQPEDNMDNKTIYSNLVKILKKTKYKWQVITVTHSAQIVINADIDKYIIPEIKKDKSSIGSLIIKEQKYVEESINDPKFITLLEGSETAMKQRFKKYNINSNNVDEWEKKLNHEIYEEIRGNGN